MACTMTNTRHRKRHVGTKWRDAVEGGRKKLIRVLRVQCEYCYREWRIETKCGIGPLVVK